MKSSPVVAHTFIAAAIHSLLNNVGEDAAREGLKDTPDRVAKAWLEEWASGYSQKPEDVLKSFKDGAENYDQLILVRDIPFYSHCEHHITPFFGRAHVGYIPGRRIVGLSKLSRLVDIFAKRLQVQERLTCQVADAIDQYLDPEGVGVVLEARHLCMESRGIAKPGTVTVTSALRGSLLTQPEARAEFLQLTRSAPNVAV